MLHIPLLPLLFRKGTKSFQVYRGDEQLRRFSMRTNDTRPPTVTTVFMPGASGNGDSVPLTRQFPKDIDLELGARNGNADVCFLSC